MFMVCGRHPVAATGAIAMGGPAALLVSFDSTHVPAKAMSFEAQIFERCFERCWNMLRMDLTERCDGVRCRFAPGEGRVGGMAAHASMCSRRISSICRGSIAGDIRITPLLTHDASFARLLMDGGVARDDAQRSLFSLFYVQNGRKGTDHCVSLFYHIASLI